MSRKLHWRRTLSVEQPQTDKALRLVERHPVPHPIREPVDHHASIVGKPLLAIRIEPAAAAVELVGKIPVEERDVRDDIRC